MFGFDAYMVYRIVKIVVLAVIIVRSASLVKSAVRVQFYE